MRRPFPFSRSRARRAAFTLIELLTVIAIIGVLAALLIPVASRARALAHQAACTSNLRQWGIALQLHLQANRDQIPYEGNDDYVRWSETQAAPNASAWFNVLPPYVGSLPLSELAARGRDFTSEAKRAWFTGVNAFYACGADRRSALSKADAYVAPSYMMNSQIYTSEGPAGTKDGLKPVRLRDLPRHVSPTRLAFMADAGNDGGSTFTDGVGTGTDRPRIRGHGDNLDFRHNKGVNVVYLDGHVRKFSMGEFQEVSNARFNRPDLIWNPWLAE